MFQAAGARPVPPSGGGSLYLGYARAGVAAEAKSTATRTSGGKPATGVIEPRSPLDAARKDPLVAVRELEAARTAIAMRPEVGPSKRGDAPGRLGRFQNPLNPLRGYLQNHPHFVTVSDVPPEQFLRGLSGINGRASVACLMEDDELYLQERFSAFVEAIHSDEQEDEETTKQMRHLPREERAKARFAHHQSHPTTSTEPQGDLDRTQRAPHHSVASDELERSAENESYRFRLVPWRFVFRDWLAFLSASMRELHPKLPNRVVPLELFLQRARDATTATSAAAPRRTSPERRGRPPKLAQQHLAPDHIFVHYGPFVPHLILTASALYVFDVHLVPLLEARFHKLVRQALHQLMLAVYVEPPPSVFTHVVPPPAGPPDVTALLRQHRLQLQSKQRAEDRRVDARTPDSLDDIEDVASASAASVASGAARAVMMPQPPPSVLGTSDESFVYVRSTYLQRFHETVATYQVLLAINRQRAAVVEKQNALISRTVLKMMSQTGKRLLRAWHLYARRCTRLKQRFRHVFVSLSETAVVRVAVRNWLQVAQSTFALEERKRRKSATVDPHAIAMGLQVQMYQSLSMLAKQKQIMANLLEAASTGCRTLAEKHHATRQQLLSTRERQQRISNSFLGVMDELFLPPQPGGLGGQKSAIGEGSGGNDGGNLGGGRSLAPFFGESSLLDDRGEECHPALVERSKLIQWMAQLSVRDSAITGAQLPAWLATYFAGPGSSSSATSTATSVASPPSPLTYPSTTSVSGGGSPGFNLAVLARVSHLMPILRLALTLVLPPPSVVAASNAFSKLHNNGSTSSSTFVAFSSENDEGNECLDADVVEAVPELARMTTGIASSAAKHRLQQKHNELSMMLQRELRAGEPSSESVQGSAGEGSSETVGANASEFGPVEQSVALDRQDSLGDAARGTTGAGGPDPLPNPKHEREQKEQDKLRRDSQNMSRRASDRRRTMAKVRFVAGSKDNASTSSAIAAPAVSFSSAPSKFSSASMFLSDSDQARLKQLAPLMRGLDTAGSSLGFAHFMLGIVVKVAKNTSMPFPRILPPTHALRLTGRSEPWRFLILSYLYYTQFANHAGCFRVMSVSAQEILQARHKSLAYAADTLGDASALPQQPVPRAPGVSAATRRSTAAVKGVLGSSPLGGTTVSGVFLPPPVITQRGEPALGGAASVRAVWDERRRQRAATGEDERAKAASDFHDASVRAVAQEVLSGGQLAQECASLYTVMVGSNPWDGDTALVPHDFLAAKMRIVFGKDSSFWRPATSSRNVASVNDLVDYLQTVAMAASCHPLELCERLRASFTDTDLFFASVSSQLVQEAFEAHLGDLSVVFSLYATGEAPSYSILIEGWLALTQPLFDSQFTAQMAESTFKQIIGRSRRRPAPAPGESPSAAEVFGVPGRRSSHVSDASVLVHSVSSAALTQTPRAVTLSPQQGSLSASIPPLDAGAAAPQGLDMESFCQALCVVIAFKAPNPFIALEAKVAPFITNVLVPIVGSKVKSSFLQSGPSVTKQSVR